MAHLWTTARRHWWSTAVATLAAVAVAILLFMLARISTASRQLDGLRVQQTQQSHVVTDLASNLADAQQQLRQHGIAPAQPPPQQIIEQGQTGAQGPAGAQGPGPTDAQVAAAVAAYMSTHPAPPGATGPGPSLDQITAAVTAYLKANPLPPGPTGATGAPGPGPSDGQVADAVAVYMASHPAPIGPAGPTGASGSPGKDGAPGAPGPAGATGPPPSGWTFTDRGVTYSCLPDSQAPGPHYTCTALSPSPSPSTSPPGGTAAGSATPAAYKIPGHRREHRSLLSGALLFGVYVDRRILTSNYLT